MATRAGKVDPQDARRVRHTRIGVWDLYEERQTSSSLLRMPGSSIVETCAQMIQNTPYVVRMLKDVFSIRRVQILLPIFLVIEFLDSVIPAVSLWYSGQLLRLIPTAIESHAIDSTVLIHAAVGHLTCKVVSHLLQYIQPLVVLPMDRSVEQFYAGHIFHSTARLDLPTMEDPAVQKQLHSVMPNWSHSVAWETIEASTNIVMTLISMFSQLLVLFAVLQEQQDGLLLIVLGCLRSILLWYSRKPNMSSPSVWAATTTNRDYMRMHGLEKLVNDDSHRKELVAGNLSEYITAQFRKSAQRVGDDTGDFREIRRVHYDKKHLSVFSILRELMHELPQIIFTLCVVQKPMTILLSLASFILIEHTSHSFVSTQSIFFDFSLAKQFANIHNLYEIENVENKIVDGVESFPENQQALRSGVSLEFRNVSFQYPGAERCALRNVSFKIGAGQLCVIVGTNGSGKSTILKLVSRIYDPTEGIILINNRDIKTLRLADLRAAMSILFQDYTHFPLSADTREYRTWQPALAHDDDKIREAAHLGGAEDFVDELPDGFNTYVRRPVRDDYPDFPMTPSGQPMDFSLVQSVGGFRVPEDLSLSGGQMQRLAVSRTFMRSLATETESSVGMLLFDEPSASLDPTAEHDLFERLRKLRGNKSMIFSTHRFGNLTRYADLILYVDESVQEQGTHDELVRKGGEYARIWNLQAKPFL